MIRPEPLPSAACDDLAVRAADFESVFAQLDSLEVALQQARAQLDAMLGDRQDSGPTRPEIDSAARVARRILDIRHDLRAHFGIGFIQDPAFEVLLELYVSAASSRRLSASSAYSGTDLALTTSSRWLARLSAAGIVIRDADPADGRRIWVSLSNHAFATLTQALHSMHEPETRR